MSRQKNYKGAAGFTLLELLIVMLVFSIVISGAMGFMTVQQNAYNKGIDLLLTLQNLRYAYETLEIDLGTLAQQRGALQDVA